MVISTTAGAGSRKPAAKVPVMKGSALKSAAAAPWKAGCAAGTDLPRKRLTEEPMMGEVVSFKGKVGWIRPESPLDHPKAKMRKGDLYLHAKDLVGVDSLEEGQFVQFQVYEDKSGLGAEECSPL
mmetsp:Transcript_143716/g.459915  ORF Transcript_143716/g.459915 Transcript_143716/m.459915 type:complete len:125 (+) Transcript_143716:349-723(+)